MFSKSSAAYTTLGFELVGLIVAFVFVGNYLDAKFGWGGIGLVGGVTIAFIGWIVHLLFVVQMLAKREKSGDIDAS